ncbi:piggyBac transposable element-derived protein 4-like [Schistocerca cancellata]|uniref:piggyBac transposable element-derived protein 4-like n=1 Tax=Schistocerca cancellata TaxID=274614 RepID=UPI002118EE31|nr:piggyBac transposable element-derived protein 4-like [Schistocerca cancellata]
MSCSTYDLPEDVINQDGKGRPRETGEASTSPSVNPFVQDDETGAFTDSHWDDYVTHFEELNLPLVFDPKPIVNFALICFQTNLYAKQKNSAQWRELTVQELKAFLGMIILMGIHQLPEAASYWSSDPYLNVNAVSNVMTLARYKKIIENGHCNDNSFQPATNYPGYDKLYKIRPLISALNKSCLKVYHPSTSLAVDESMVAFKGSTRLKQYVPMKPVKRGYKIWCLADANTGFISNFDVYTGKSATSRGEFKDCQMCERVVLELCKTFFNSNKLRKWGFYSCGTVRGNRKGLPPFLASKLPSLNRGEFTSAVKSGVAAVKWQDSKAVCLLSTAHNPKDVTKRKPAVISNEASKADDKWIFIKNDEGPITCFLF